MILSLNSSSSILTIAAVAGILLLVVLFLLDARHSRHKRELRKKILDYVTAHTAQSYSVIIEFGQDDHDNFMSFLTMLISQNYSLLQVIALVDDTVVPKEFNKLRKVQRNHKKILPIRLVRLRSATLKHKLVKRYASGTIYIELSLTDTISNHFFERVSLEFINEKVDAVSPRVSLQVYDSLLRASLAILTIWRSIFRSVGNKIDASRSAVRSSTYISGRSNSATYIEQADVMVRELPVVSWRSILVPLFLTIVSVVGVILSTVEPNQWLLATVLVLSSFAMLPMIRVLTYPYSFITRISLLALMPLWPLTMILSYFAIRINPKNFRSNRIRQAELVQ